VTATAGPQDSDTARRSLLRGRWIDHWEPEDETFWARTGRAVANRNLMFSVLSEHIGFSVWTLWSVLVLFMGPDYHIDAAGKFFLVSVPTLVGAVLRLPYTFAVARFGGRGGNVASSMTNINAYFPERHKGWALGLNAGGGNIGVPVIQLLALLVIATAGAGHPRILLAVYIPLIVVAAALSALYMDNLSSVRNDTGAFQESIRENHTWIMAFVYIGTFGSFIGYSFAFGLVLQNQFGRTPLQAAAITFIGPLLGSLIRPVGGRLADRHGGAKVTFVNFIAMVVASAVILVGSGAKSLAIYATGFIVLFVLTGVGNGSTYEMIPAIFRGKALAAIANGGDERTQLLRARRISGAAIGIIGAVGAFGGVLINMAFRQSFLTAKTGDPAFWAFIAFYLVCIAVTYVVYLRPAPVGVAHPRAAYARV
jgi:NNP family nitrate/nitrite transporter-like MFS transporter